nr:unnamed protein product [Digitaria exilis]
MAREAGGTGRRGAQAAGAVAGGKTAGGAKARCGRRQERRGYEGEVRPAAGEARPCGRGVAGQRQPAGGVRPRGDAVGRRQQESRLLRRDLRESRGWACGGCGWGVGEERG